MFTSNICFSFAFLFLLIIVNLQYLSFFKLKLLDAVTHSYLFNFSIFVNFYSKNLIYCLLSYRVLLRVRMLYYIKHEIIGDLVQHINDGVHVR